MSAPKSQPQPDGQRAHSLHRLVGPSLFWIGITMIAYDATGHTVCAVARKTVRGPYLWNTYSPYIWPIRPDPFVYDMYWSVFFWTAIALLITGYRLRRPNEKVSHEAGQ